MNTEYKNVLQVNINHKQEIVQLLYVEGIVKPVKVGMILNKIIGSDFNETLKRAIEEGLNQVDEEHNVKNDYFNGKIKIEVNKNHPQSYNVKIYIEKSVKKNKPINPLETLLLDLSTDGIIVVDRFGYIQYSNKAFSEMSKYPLSSLKGKIFYPLFIRSREWLVNTESFSMCYDDMIALDGTLIPIQIIKHFLKISDHQKGFVYIIKNVSQLKSVEQELSLRENIIESILFASQQFLFSTDWEKNIHKVLAHLGNSIKASRINLIENNVNNNEELCMKFNASWTNENNTEFESVQKCIPYFPEHDEMFSELSSGNIFIAENNEELNFYHKDFKFKSAILIPIFKNDDWWGFLEVDECSGRRTWKQSEILALKQIANIIGAAVIQKTNIQHIESLRLKSEESDRLKTAFLSNIGHELRTPLNAVLGFSDLLKKYSLTDDKRMEYLHFISDNSQKLLKSIDLLVTFAKLEAGNINIIPEQINIFNFLQELAVYINSEITKSAKKISLSVQCADKEMFIITDKKMLIQIFSQLISNAIKFTASGVIEIGLKKDNYFTFYVSDTGKGIEKDKISYIFNRFRVLENETTRITPGMGIGLPIAKRLVEHLQGTIYLESELNSGTVVYFKLPERLAIKHHQVNYNEFNESDTIYLLEENNDIYFKLYTILKSRYPTIKRAYNLKEIDPQNASIIILNTGKINAEELQYIKNIEKRFPQLKIVNQTFSTSKSTVSTEIVTLPNSYKELLPSIKSILK